MSLRPAPGAAAARASRRATPARTRKLDDVLAAAGTMPTGMLSALGGMKAATVSTPPGAQPSAPSAPKFPKVFKDQDDERHETVKRMVNLLNPISWKWEYPSDFSLGGFYFRALLDDDQTFIGFEASMEPSRRPSIYEWLTTVAGEKFTITYQKSGYPDYGNWKTPFHYTVTYADKSADHFVIDYEWPGGWDLAHIWAGRLRLTTPVWKARFLDAKSWGYPRLVARVDADGVRTEYDKDDKTLVMTEDGEKFAFWCIALLFAYGVVLSQRDGRRAGTLRRARADPRSPPPLEPQSPRSPAYREYVPPPDTPPGLRRFGSGMDGIAE